MAEEQSVQTLPSAPFPAPPPFWKHFTTTNLSTLAVKQKGSASSEASERALPLQLPLELTYLLPPQPPPPDATTYRTFNTTIPISPAPLPPPSDDLLFDPESKPLSTLPALLQQFTRSIILNFLELTTILAQDPSQHAHKIQDIKKLLRNWNHAVNMYRPHQAREGVIEMLEGMVEDGEEEIERCDRMKTRIEEFLHGVEERGDGGVISQTVLSGEHLSGAGKLGDQSWQEEEASRRLWKAIWKLEND